jgi:hypothetical protein
MRIANARLGNGAGLTGNQSVFVSKPSAGSKFSDAIGREVSESRQDASEIGAHRDFEPATGFDKGEDGSDARTSFEIRSELSPQN